MRWVDREPPLAPSGMVARGAAARVLAARLAQHPGVGVRGVAGAGLIALLAPADRLPWVEGAIWLGSDPLAPTLLLPTTRRPADPIEWVEAAVLRQAAHKLAALLEDGSVIPLDRARPVGEAEIARFLAGGWP
jgi:hypothetical protein